MNSAKMYAKFYKLPKSFTTSFLNEYLHLLEFKDGENHFEIGCGSGGSTRNLLKVIPETYNKFIATDVSTDMIEFANLNKTNQHPRLHYLRLDITDKKGTDPFVNTVDKVFSFLALHWVSPRDQITAFENMNKLLKKNGDLFVSVIKDIPFFQVYGELYKNKKWETHMKPLQEFCSSPYKSDIAGRNENLFDILTKSGFHIKLFHNKVHYYNFESDDELVNVAKAVNPFLERMPLELRNEYWNDTMHGLRKVYDINTNVSFQTELIFLHVKKL